MTKLKFAQRFASEDNTPAAPGGAEATFDDGQGKKELIVMEGPLSEMITKALNLYLVKKPLDEGERDEDGETATESQAIDAELAAAVAQASKHADSFYEAASRVRLVSQYDDFDESPDAVVINVPEESVTSPQEVDRIENAAGKAAGQNRDVVVMVTTVNNNGFGEVVEKAIAATQDDGLTAENVGQVLDNNSGPVYDADICEAAERIYDKMPGVTLVYGIEGFAQWLKIRHGLSGV